mmetsp:Transcript_3676/g.2747  ORF Transcript_3676/g.2747 Transcript_3676/m.2747 type:complete len:189 (+) Transcript_3676:382-948(+)
MRRVAKMRKLCANLFTEAENQTFIGETILKNAAREKNAERRDELMKHAIEQIQKEPAGIDLRSVVPVLIDSGHYLSLVELCLRKAAALQREGEDQDEKDECYALVLSLFSALEFSITNEASANIIDYLRTKSGYVGSNGEDPYFAMFLKKLKEFPKTEMKVILRNKIVKKIEESGDGILIWTIFNFLI